jgi:hypothetical protein
MDAEAELVIVLSRREARALLRDASVRGIEPTTRQDDSDALSTAFKKLAAALLAIERGQR